MVTTTPFYIMKHKQNRLARYHGKQEVAMKDLARIVNLSTTTLSRVERGLQEPTTRLFLLYHLLFDDISIPSYFKQQYADWISSIVTRTQELMSELTSKHTPKANYRVSYLKHIINRLNELEYEAKK